MHRNPILARPILSATLFGVVGLVLFVFASIHDNQQLRAVVDAAEARKIARENLILAEHLFSLLKDMESGQRGYLLTGDPAYLRPYEDAKRQVAETHPRLRQGVVKVLGPASRIKTLDALIERRLAMAEGNIVLRRKSGLEAVVRSGLLEQGNQVMEAIRGEFARLEGVMQETVRSREQWLQDQHQSAFRASLGLAVLGVLMLGLAYALLLREMRRRLGAEQALKEANAHLEDVVRQRTAELAEANASLRLYATALDSSIEAERRRLAREVHDQLGQIFTALKLRLAGGALPEGRMQEFHRLLDEGIEVARRISADLRPPMLDDLGLAPALKHFATQQARQAGLACSVDIRDEPRLNAAQANQLFRIAQEALVNVVRHAGAGKVTILGQATDGRYVLSVSDDGKGLGHGSPRPGAMGLLGMRERAHLAGGECRITALASGGTQVEVILPLAGEGHAHPDPR